MRPPPEAIRSKRALLACCIGLTLLESSFAARRDQDETGAEEAEDSCTDARKADDLAGDAHKRAAPKDASATELGAFKPAPASAEVSPSELRDARKRAAPKDASAKEFGATKVAPASAEVSRKEKRQRRNSSQNGLGHYLEAIGKREDRADYDEVRAKLDEWKNKYEKATKEAKVAIEGAFAMPEISWDDKFRYRLEFLGNFYVLPDWKRNRRRDGTKEFLANTLGFPDFHALENADVRSANMSAVRFRSKTILYRDSSPARLKEGLALAGKEFLLRRYEVLCAYVHADFDFHWDMTSGRFKHNFWVAHAAALNVGESQASAYDFQDFADNQSSFKQSDYAEAMGRIVQLIVIASNTLNVTDLVFFPFGMGAFIRNLKYMDTKYDDNLLMQQLRAEVALGFVRALRAVAQDTRIHLCLRFTPFVGEGSETSNIETLGNTAAFLRAVREPRDMAALKDRLIVWPDADSMQIAQGLAAAGGTAMLVNGANRKKIGNHWYQGGARQAIDENLHRRSWTMSAISYYVNSGFKDTSQRGANDLPSRVAELGGRVLDVRFKRP
eukprot:TRINITY_DN27458_c0_g1_i1.p1 TRINITY_DN27458_c0_g1~~TRINITY_DN27458_c0_g1_i1.p1  ORF type:complete len:557 (+),score=76.72 TRINITY_DN27458_c0_g1_i1:174-1844(+)